MGVGVDARAAGDIGAVVHRDVAAAGRKNSEARRIDDTGVIDGDVAATGEQAFLNDVDAVIGDAAGRGVDVDGIRIGDEDRRPACHACRGGKNTGGLIDRSGNVADGAAGSIHRNEIRRRIAACRRAFRVNAVNRRARDAARRGDLAAALTFWSDTS